MAPWRTIILGVMLTAGGMRPPDVAAEPRRTETIGKGSAYETPFHVFRGALPCPVVLVEGGIHGNEQSGTRAIDMLLARINVKAGTLILFPRMNRQAVERNVRLINVDLNRTFSNGKQGTSYEYRLAAEISDMVGREGVEHLLTLHDAAVRHDPSRKENYGQTICYGVRPPPAYLHQWIERLNTHAQSKAERFTAFYSPIVQSSTEYLVERHKLKGGFCGETWNGLSAARRIALQEAMILTLLETVGLVYSLDAEASGK